MYKLKRELRETRHSIKETNDKVIITLNKEELKMNYRSAKLDMYFTTSGDVKTTCGKYKLGINCSKLETPKAVKEIAVTTDINEVAKKLASNPELLQMLAGLLNK